MPDHSYVTIRSRLSASVQDILASVTEKLQYSEEQGAREDALVLVTVASSGGGHGAWGGGQGIGEVVLTPPNLLFGQRKPCCSPARSASSPRWASTATSSPAPATPSTRW